MLILPGEPVSQARMRHTTVGGFSRAYDPKAKEKESIRKYLTALKLQNNFCDSFSFPMVSFLFFFPIPKSIRKSEKTFFESGVRKHDKKPDTDNLVKLYLDCLDGIFLEGDQKVLLGTCTKLYHPIPQTVIHIQETKSQLDIAEVDFHLLNALKRDKWSFFAQGCPFDCDNPSPLAP